MEFPKDVGDVKIEFYGDIGHEVEVIHKIKSSVSSLLRILRLSFKLRPPQKYRPLRYIILPANSAEDKDTGQPGDLRRRLRVDLNNAHWMTDLEEEVLEDIVTLQPLVWDKQLRKSILFRSFVRCVHKIQENGCSLLYYKPCVSDEYESDDQLVCHMDIFGLVLHNGKSGTKWLLQALSESSSKEFTRDETIQLLCRVSRGRWKVDSNSMYTKPWSLWDAYEYLGFLPKRVVLPGLAVIVGLGFVQSYHSAWEADRVGAMFVSDMSNKQFIEEVILVALLTVFVPFACLGIMQPVVNFGVITYMTALRTAACKQLMKASWTDYALSDVELLIQLLGKDCVYVQMLLMFFSFSIITLLQALVSGVQMWNYHPVFVCFFILGPPVANKIMSTPKAWLIRANNSKRLLEDEIVTKLGEIVQGFTTARLSGLNGLMSQSFSQHCEMVSKSLFAYESKIAIISQAIALVPWKISVGCTLSVIALTREGHMNFGEAFAGLTLYNTALAQINTLIMQIPLILQTLPVLRRLSHFFSLGTSECWISDDASNQSTLRFESLEAFSLSLGYGRFEHSLTDVHARISKGDKVYLVGRSGCGKSTLLKGMTGLIEPMGGTLKINGEPLAHIQPVWQERVIAVVSQEPFLFNRTVEENIMLGNMRANQAQIINAATQAGVHGLCGTNNPVGRGGSRLSGGQRQRVAIARAFVREPQVLFLDEATSALDAFSKNSIAESLHRLCATERTMIAITHDLSEIEASDKVYALARMCIVESGCRDELLALDGGEFASIYNQHKMVRDLKSGNDVSLPFLQSVSIFKTLPESKLVELKESFEYINCTGNQVLFQQGDEGDACYILVTGRVEISVKNGERDVKLAVLGPGDVFGEMSLINGAPRMASAKFLMPGAVLMLTRHMFSETKMEQVQAHMSQLAERRSTINGNTTDPTLCNDIVSAHQPCLEPEE
mmetsp:Transcript_18240/g.61972  ORF Transcript_18240/g.61972 Transcript_18240/m.61972 type:complete len:951 (-) Transcript_18240:109-2961(-)|eukprot:CAMPEP_0183807028 /NCGR_PEP_ID=MMETSP0803_2-20130417/40516_1 /TAXON_ID=195967 /ORGANISM="Crustomastix stigmata, Strain CCMP3273" /LENGTH=950 /DNA_ID=CAMNT_0026051801 /DNA_START=138 /DNA_END=2993 /DNA_ORIENTATION=-